jgi:hypothetical protein
MNQSRLQETLQQNGIPPAEAAEVAQVAVYLDQLPAPLARREVQNTLLATLVTELPRRKTAWERLCENYGVLVLYSQLRLIQREIWTASAFTLALGVIVTLSVPSGAAVPFVILTPIVAAAGIAFLYDDTAAAMLDIEATTRANGRLLLLARLALVFGFDLCLALIGSIVLAFLRTDLSLMPLIMAWLAPMTFLSALAFVLSVTLMDTLAAMVFALALWVLHWLFRQVAHEHLLYWLLSMPALGAADYRWGLFGGAGALVLLGVWLIGVQERRLGEWHS